MWITLNSIHRRKKVYEQGIRKYNVICVFSIQQQNKDTLKIEGKSCKNMTAVPYIRQCGVNLRTFFTKLIGKVMHVTVNKHYLPVTGE